MTDLYDRDQCREMFELVFQGCDLEPLDGVAYHVLAIHLRAAAEILKTLSQQKRAHTGPGPN